MKETENVVSSVKHEFYRPLKHQHLIFLVSIDTPENVAFSVRFEFALKKKINHFFFKPRFGNPAFIVCETNEATL